ncbi:hypothetical protein [Streptomyces mirabilis]|uniref:hypothetical protein n=1 Tax=Streptomyces mirabilis TaxID=68239 RepID=UPI00365862A1
MGEGQEQGRGPIGAGWSWATLLDAAGITPDTPHDGHSLLGTRDRDHVLAEWWWNRQDKQPIHS